MEEEEEEEIMMCHQKSSIKLPAPLLQRCEIIQLSSTRALNFLPQCMRTYVIKS